MVSKVISKHGQTKNNKKLMQNSDIIFFQISCRWH